MKPIYDFIANYFYVFIVPFLSIAVYLSLQYLTRGMSFFIDERGNIKWKFLVFSATLQFFVSIIITWSVLSAFSSDFLSEYETIKITSVIIIGAAPFNITILVWVALKLETYKMMRSRYGDEFIQDDFFIKASEVQKIEDTRTHTTKPDIKDSSYSINTQTKETK
ncbi:hypothetical protein [Helicobacter trogontum]|uniref:Uncharacterized protein n=1 Tax=Helicobacter trogontum TaxID=50960 RepID=A0A4U8SDV6_9HELI|nr:hypothetical protein [Helicobacter trogontum]TLD84261.1 hypothetical protein LS81_002000 [Helicobacter trogontum]